MAMTVVMAALAASNAALLAVGAVHGSHWLVLTFNVVAIAACAFAAGVNFMASIRR